MTSGRSAGAASVSLPEPSHPLDIFVVCPPGFEDLVARELRENGLAPWEQVPGGVSLTGNWPDIYRANLWSRVATRVLVRVASFEARTFARLAECLRQVPWADWIFPGAPLAIRVAKRKTRLYHTRKVEDVVREALGAPSPGGGALLPTLYIRISGDRVQLSLDTSGDRLHRRGYRVEAGEAPLRENLAAGLLMRAGWDGSEALYDPMCGSGTLVLEAAWMALRIPPGGLRRFAFEGLPSFRLEAWHRIREDARAGSRRSGPIRLFASDTSEEAVARTVRAARRAGLTGELEVAIGRVGELEPPEARGLLVCNPPYGHRLGGAVSARRVLGEALKGPFRAWRWGLVCLAGVREPAKGLSGYEEHSFRSGGLRLRFCLGGPECGPGDGASRPGACGSGNGE